MFTVGGASFTVGGAQFTVGETVFTVGGASFTVGGATQNCYGPKIWKIEKWEDYREKLITMKFNPQNSFMYFLNLDFFSQVGHFIH